MSTHMTLFELNSLVSEVLENAMPRQYWVEAELSDVNERRGHLFAELIEKDEDSNTPVARASAKCWASTWYSLKRTFERVTGEQLRTGMKVLLKVYVQFHPAYGFSWIITDIDPTFTLGDLSKKRMEIIAQLKAEGIFDMQRQLSLPMFCQHIAVISSATAAGYGDFCNHLHNNPYGFFFKTTLFHAVMQGEQIESSVIDALNRIFDAHEEYDCVVIIRGGGATSDMSGFDTLDLAENVANFPLPIITGIGHDRDECILDMISFHRVKTPTAAADFLLSHLDNTSRTIDNLADRMVRSVARYLETERVRMKGISSKIPILFSMVKANETNRIELLSKRIENALRQKTEQENHRLQMLQQTIEVAVRLAIEKERHRLSLLAQKGLSLDPEIILKRGYSITLSGGKVVTDASKIIKGEILETKLANGTVLSKKM